LMLCVAIWPGQAPGRGSNFLLEQANDRHTKAAGSVGWLPLLENLINLGSRTTPDL